jgi:hypothetical protein
MGASGWNCVVGYDGNPNSLLPSLETHVFASRRFQIPIVEPEFLEEIDFFSVAEAEREEMADQYGLRPVLTVANRVGFANFIQWCVERMQSETVETLDELRALQCISSSGTHSPLDMYGVSNSPEDFKLCALTAEQTIKVFGNRHVQRTDVASMEMFIARAIPNAYVRWQGVYVPVYDGDTITHAYVEGASGD